jgi:hypothetical protein
MPKLWFGDNIDAMDATVNSMTYLRWYENIVLYEKSNCRYSYVKRYRSNVGTLLKISPTASTVPSHSRCRIIKRNGNTGGGEIHEAPVLECVSNTRTKRPSQTSGSSPKTTNNNVSLPTCSVCDQQMQERKFDWHRLRRRRQPSSVTRTLAAEARIIII